MRWHKNEGQPIMISFCKLLENSVLSTPKMRDVMSEPVIAGMNIN